MLGTRRRSPSSGVITRTGPPPASVEGRTAHPLRRPRPAKKLAARSRRGKPRREVMERLSRPIDDLAEHYDVIVVGSGYGGSIAACRLSRAGRTVALFERGRELHPGEYPTSAEAALPHVQVSARDRDIGDA